MYFECNKSGHFRSECPHLSKEHKKKKKAFMAAWGDSEYSSFEDEQKETANICFMAWGDEISSTSLLNFDFDIDELFGSYNKLIIEFKKIHKKRKETNLLNEKINNQLEELAKEKDKLALDNETLKNKKVSLDESLKDLVKKNKDLISKNKNLTKDLEKTKSLIDRFILSSTRLGMMLKS